MKTIQSNKPGYKTSVVIKAEKRSVFDALTKNIDAWWGKTDNPLSRLNDEFTVSWGEPWYRFRVIDFHPAEKISWECIDSRQIIGDLQGVEKEWVGTRLYWEIQQQDSNEVEVTLFHEGLIPEFICYDVCSTTWDHYLSAELKSFLETH